MQEVTNYLRNILKLNSKDTIVVGVSAGPDSMTLLYILNKLKDDLKFKIVVAHVNHNIRVEESREEAIFLENYCVERNLLFEKMLITNYGDDNFHNEARNIRYNFYKELINKYNANYLMTGHHGDDLMETILMRIVRGSTLSGYSGFSIYNDMGNYKIVRPLIFATKDELKEYADKNKIPYRIDKSNFSDKYTRNRYRKNVLPFLKMEDINVHKKFYKFSETLMEYDKYMENEQKKVMDNVYKDNYIIIPKFILLEELMQKRIIDYILAKIYIDDMMQITDHHVDLILKLINSKKSNIKYNLPNDYLAIKEYDKVLIKKNIDSINIYDIELDDEVFLPNGMKLVRLSDTNENGNDILRINSSDVIMPLRVRTRKNGDKLIVKNMNGYKKLSEIFINAKIPLEKRDKWPVVVDSNDNIIWVPKLKKTKYNRLKNDSCDIIFKCY